MASESTGGGEMATAVDLRPLHARAAQQFVGYVQRIQPSQWGSPTPCSAWDVRALVDHVVRWNTFVPEFLAGRGLADMEDAFGRDVLGDDPATSAATSAQRAVDAFDAPGALERIVRHPIGEIPGAQVLYLRLFDNAIHGWDLARALGLEGSIDAQLSEFLYGVSLTQRDQIRASGQFGPAEVPVPEGANVQARLLGLLGRPA